MPKPTPASTGNDFKITSLLLPNGVGELLLYGTISDERWWDDEQIVVPKEVDSEIKKLGSVSRLHVRINSYGGSVYAGQAIATMIDRLKVNGCKVTSFVDGIAASMGSVIAMVGDEVVMAENAVMMIHKPLTAARGNANDLAKAIDRLNKAEQTAIALYMRHFKGTEEELKQMLAVETLLTGKEAYEVGLCTTLEGPVNVAACATGFVFNGMEVPRALLTNMQDKITPYNKGGEKDMFLNEETQGRIEKCFGTLSGVDVKSVVLTQNADGTYAVKAEEIAAPPIAFLTAEQVQAKAGREMTADEVLAVLDEAKTLKAKLDAIGDTEGLQAKAAEFDKMKTTAITNALKCGVKAKGDRFDQERWGKTLAAFSYDEIIAQADEWTADAAEALKAGRRVSSYSGESSNAIEAPDEVFKA